MSLKLEGDSLVVEMEDGLLGLSRRQSHIFTSYPFASTECPFGEFLENFERFVELFLTIDVIKCGSNNECES